MTPGSKKTLLLSKKSGRRYFLVRSLTRPNGRRYYICSNSACKARVSREADLYCRTSVERFIDLQLDSSFLLHSSHAQASSSLEQLGSNENTADTSIQSDQSTGKGIAWTSIDRCFSLVDENDLSQVLKEENSNSVRQWESSLILVIGSFSGATSNGKSPKSR